jgi:hypothetical protein
MALNADGSVTVPISDDLRAHLTAAYGIDFMNSREGTVAILLVRIQQLEAQLQGLRSRAGTIDPESNK